MNLSVTSHPFQLQNQVMQNEVVTEEEQIILKNVYAITKLPIELSRLVNEYVKVYYPWEDRTFRLTVHINSPRKLINHFFSFVSSNSSISIKIVLLDRVKCDFMVNFNGKNILKIKKYMEIENVLFANKEPVYGEDDSHFSLICHEEKEIECMIAFLVMHHRFPDPSFQEIKQIIKNFFKLIC